MSLFLYKLGKTAYGKPWYFIVCWIVILGAVLALLGVNGIKVSSELKIEGTESQKVLDQLAEKLPEASGGQASVVFRVPAGQRLDTPERLTSIAKAVNDVYSLEYVINPAEAYAQAASGANGAQAAAASGGRQAGSNQAGSGQAGVSVPGAQSSPGAQDASEVGGLQCADMSAPFSPMIAGGVPVPGVIISADGTTALFQFQFTVPQMSLPESVPDTVIEAVTAVEKDGAGIEALPSDSLTAKPSIGSTEGLGLIVAAVVLFLTLGSALAAGLPLVVALMGVGVSVGGAYAISSFISLSDITPVLALMIGLAVGIDYALFIVNRQRRLILDQGLSAREAAGRAIGTAGNAVVFAGLTVIIALCGMLVIGIAFLSTMALIAAATVLIDVLVALTALLGLIGERICSAKARSKAHAAGTEVRHGVARGWVNGVVKYRGLVMIGLVVVLGAAATPVAKMELAIPSGATANQDTAARQSYDAITSGFGEGFNGPLLLVAEPRGASAAVTPDWLTGIVQDLNALDNVFVATAAGISKTGDTAIISVIPKTGPTDAKTQRLVRDLRASDSPIAQKYGADIGVTGFTAINIDMSAKLAQVFPIYVLTIVILSLIILLLVFRSIIVPIKATVGFLLSVLATFGIATAVFQWGWLHSLFDFDTGGPLLSFLPIMVTGILYGLAMDYQVFLVSSMRESYVHGHEADSVEHGYEQASRVVVAAAVIMVSVFAGFIFAEDIMIKQIGFALALGILIDAFLVRMAIVPAVMKTFGRLAWRLPKWLDRWLPNLDVEGDRLISMLNRQNGADAPADARRQP